VSESGPEVLYRVEAGVATVTLNRPGKRNALDQAAIRLVRHHLAEAREDPDVRVVVVTGAGEKAFCSGVDLSGSDGGGFLGDHAGREQLPRLFLDLYGLGKPTVARVQGYALAGGFGLALACDLVVAAEDAVFGAPELDVGLWPFVITVPLVRSMPPKKALELMLSARRVGSEEAERLGFVNRVVPASDLDEAVAELASTLARRPPLAIKMGRDSFYSVWDQSAESALRLLHSQLSLLTATEDAKEGMAAFRERRPPRWSGR
jgi:enoyl-CoA hydratase/carnithine racemase